MGYYGYELYNEQTIEYILNLSVDVLGFAPKFGPAVTGGWFMGNYVIGDSINYIDEKYFDSALRSTITDGLCYATSDC